MNTNGLNKNMMVDEFINRLKDCIDVESEYTNGDDLDEMIEHIKDAMENGIVPIIFDDMYEYYDENEGKRQSLHSYVVERIIRKSRQRPHFTKKELTEILNGGYFGISLLLKKINGNYNNVYDVYKEAGNRIQLKKHVRNFLIRGNFPLIVTTSCFPIIENDEILRRKGYYSYYYTLPTPSNSISDEKLKCEHEREFPQRCIYHIFGKACRNGYKWGYNEKMILEFLKAAHSDMCTYKNLRGYFNHQPPKTMLLLGNNTPDWLFRFLVSSMYGRDIYDEDCGYFITEGTGRTEFSLNKFLTDISFETETQMDTVLKSVYENFPKPDETKYVFISYAHEDHDIAIKIKEKLENTNKDAKLKFWIDDNLVLGKRYWQDIMDKIGNSLYFLPIITNAYIEKSTVYSKEERTDVLKENGVDYLPFDVSIVHNVNKKLKNGLTTELMLAEVYSEKYCNKEKFRIVPILLKEQKWNEQDITFEALDNEIWEKSGWEFLKIQQGLGPIDSRDITFNQKLEEF